MIVGAVLGVTILLIGMAVSPTTAHRDDAFDNITCKDLRLVDEYGNLVVWLYARSGGGIEIFNKESPVVAITGMYHDFGRNALHGGNIELFSFQDSGSFSSRWTPEQFSLLAIPRKDSENSATIALSNSTTSADVSVSYGRNLDMERPSVTMRAGKHPEVRRQSAIWITNDGSRVIVK